MDNVYLPRRAAAAVAVPLFFLLVAATFWPAVRGAFFLDDYLFLAMARFIDAPWEVFWRSHIPGSLFYRPLGVFVWWTTHAAFGLRSWAHYLFDLGLHLGVCAALWRLVFVLRGRADLAWIATLLFALHPIGIGTTAWLSDRFDLLATLFSVGALGFGMEFRRRGAWRHGVLALASMACALLAKEVALAAAVALILLWIAPAEAALRRRRFGAAALLAVICLGWLAARNAILDGSVNTLREDLPALLGYLGTGFWRWGANFIDYIVWMRLGTISGVIVMAGLLGIIVAAARTLVPAERIAVLLFLLTLVIAPGVLQAPVTWTLPLHVIVDPGITVVAGSTRFYYLASVGVAALFALAWAPFVHRRVPMLALAGMLAASTVAAHALARDFHREIRAQRALGDALVRVIDALPPAGSPCLIFVLDLDPVHPLRFLGDVVVKATTSRNDIAQRCLVQSENTPWYHVAKSGAFMTAVGPLRPVSIDGIVRGPTRVGGVDLLYYNLREDMRLDASDGVFLALRNGHFEDVTAAVRRGEREVRTRCIRPPEQCR